MTTISEFVHIATVPHPDEQLPEGISKSVQAELRRIEDREVEILFPLTNASTLAKAGELAAANESEYRQLVERWIATLQEATVDPTESAGVDRELTSDTQAVHLAVPEDNERWQGALQSEAGYVAWLRRQVSEGNSEVEHAQPNQLFEETVGPFLRFLMAKRALLLGMASPLGLSPETVSSLAELADNCMIEVEDLFMAEADYGEDDGQRVSLEEVKANLGL